MAFMVKPRVCIGRKERKDRRRRSGDTSPAASSVCRLARDADARVYILISFLISAGGVIADVLFERAQFAA